MITIYKYSIPVDDQEHEVALPVDAEITLVACQTSVSFVEFWTVVDTSLPVTNRYFRVVGTGHEISSNDTVVGSTMPTPSLVWHLVERV